MPAAGTLESFYFDLVHLDMRFVPPKRAGAFDLDEPFLIGETEVTYELWLDVKTWAESNGYEFANSGQPGSLGTQGANHPVTNINWRDAMVWTNALTEYYNATRSDDLEPVYYRDEFFSTPIRVVNDTPDDGEFGFRPQSRPYEKPNADGFRLPDEAEWELAASYRQDEHGDGDITGLLEAYPGDYASGVSDATGDPSSPAEVAWYTENSGDESRGVRGRAPNALNLYDMSGNVWEWLNEAHAISCTGTSCLYPVDDSYGYRGGAFDSPEGWLGVTVEGRRNFRNVYYPFNRRSHEESANLGFRIVKDATF
jgi:formylglycine-generating enzyme required for sulfatase activity